MLLPSAFLVPILWWLPWEIWSHQLHYNFSLSALTDIPSTSRSWNFFFIPFWIKSYISSHPSSLLIPAVWHWHCMDVTFFLLKWGRSCLFSTDLLCACKCSSCPGSPPCSTHSSHLCFSSYLHHNFCSNLPPTFAYSSQASLLLFRSLSNPLSLCW